MRLDELNGLDEMAAVAQLLTCCGSTRWAERIAGGRPYGSSEVLTRAADRAFDALDPADWLEAFAAHPRIGERAAGWSAEEQSGVTAASRASFERRNRDYEARFGRTFIVCASGRSAAEMLQMLERRMMNNPDDELREAAGEQRLITHLRLAKLLS